MLLLALSIATSHSGDAVEEYSNSIARFFISHTLYVGGRLLNSLELEPLSDFAPDRIIRITVQHALEEPVSVSLTMDGKSLLSNIRRINAEGTPETETKVTSDENSTSLFFELEKMMSQKPFFEPLTLAEKEFYESMNDGTIILFEQLDGEHSNAILLNSPEFSGKSLKGISTRDFKTYSEVARKALSLGSIEFPQENLPSDSAPVNPFQ